LLLLTALEHSGRPWLAMLPLLLIDSRLSLNFVSQVTGVARGIVHGLLK
jgi:hypothetical protein